MGPTVAQYQLTLTRHLSTLKFVILTPISFINEDSGLYYRFTLIFGAKRALFCVTNGGERQLVLSDSWSHVLRDMVPIVDQ